MQDKKRQLHHEEHEGSEVNPGSAGRLTGFRDFAFGDQRLAVGSRPASRRWRIEINNILFAGETRTVPGSPLHPSSETFLTDRMTDSSTEDTEEDKYSLTMKNMKLMKRMHVVSECMRLRRIHSLTTGFLCFKTFVLPS